MSSDEKVNAMIVLEVLGRPPEHLKVTLNELAAQIDSEKGVIVKEKIINEPTPVKDQPDFYSSFAELELELEKMETLFMIVFKYLPSHIQIIEPERISLRHGDLNEMLNEITRRLHGYDEVARMLQFERDVLEKKLKEILKKEKKN